MLRGFQRLVSTFTLVSLLFSFTVVGEGTAAAEVAPIGTAPTTNLDAALRGAGYGNTPLIFEQNKGQTDPAAKFIARRSGYKLYLADREAVFSLSRPQAQSAGRSSETKDDVLRMRFAGANKNSKVSGGDESVTKTNYYIGKKRFENVSNFHRVTYTGIYDGVDAVFYGNDRNELEYDFVLAPNADPGQIALNFDGARSLSIDTSGNLSIKTENTELVQQKPVAYQQVDGVRTEIAVSYRVEDKTKRVTFSPGDYDRSQPLVIDPVLTYLTYIGGSGSEIIHAIAADSAGNSFISGATFSTDFPTANSRQDQAGAAFVAKLNSSGSALLYITFLDGEGNDGVLEFVFGTVTGTDLAVDSTGNAYIAGVTSSRQFPVTDGAYQTRKSIGCVPITTTCAAAASNEEAFVTKLNASGQISYSTYLGGRQSDAANGIAVDASGRAYVVGTTRSGLTFPRKNGYEGTGLTYGSLDGFLTVFEADGSDIIYSTGIGGVDGDAATSVALDPSNNAYVTGNTDSGGGFPTKNAAQGSSGGGTDAFVAKFNPFQSNEDSLVYSTFLGGGGTERGNGIAVNASGQAHVTGITGSANFPLKNAIDSQNQINEAFVTVYSSTGAQLHSTFLGGAGQEEGNNIALGNGGTIYVTGITLSANFPMANPFQPTRLGPSDTFVTKLRLGGSSPGVASSSFLGGTGDDAGLDIAVRGPHIFVVGNTASADLPTLSPDPLGPLKAASTGSDGFAARILDTRKDTAGTFNPTNTSFGLRNTLNSGLADINVDRGGAGDVPVTGDFNGDGIDTVSTFNNGVWKIFNTNIIIGYPTMSLVNFGQAGDLPIVGDWNGDGIETPGVFRPSVGRYFLTNSTAADPPIDVTVIFGVAEDLPVAGDWNGDGIDSVGNFRPSVGQFFLTNDNVLKATIDRVAFFGTAGDLPVAGDWDGNGLDTVGTWRPSNQFFFLTNDPDGSTTDFQFVFGLAADRPVAGDWDGKP